MKKIITLLACSMILSVHSVSTYAQNNLGEIIRQLRSMGYAPQFELLDEIYSPLQDAAPKDGVEVSWDIAYGEHERHRLDIYQPTKSLDEPSPILIFVHGGAFRGGDKDGNQNIGYYFARKGITTIVISYLLSPISYRLAPDYTWPVGAEDLASVLEWTQAHPEQMPAGDTDKIFLMGHSAGGSHVATYAFLEDLQIDNDGVIGAILLSGSNYDLTQMNDEIYFGNDSSKFPERSIISHIEGRKIPIFMTAAEFDPPPFQLQFNTLQNALYKRDGVLPASKLILDHTHISEIRHINTEDESLGPDVIRFIFSRSLE